MSIPAVLNARLIIDGRTFASVPNDENLESMTAQRLQKMCRERGLNTSGRKVDIVDRLKSYRVQKHAESLQTRCDWRDAILKMVTVFPKVQTHLHLQFHDFYLNTTLTKLGSISSQLIEAHSILDVLSEITNLAEINFGSTLENEPRERRLESSSSAFAKALSHATSLTSLKLGSEDPSFDPWFKLKGPVADRFAKSFESTPLLKKLVLSHFVLDEDSAVMLSVGLKHTPLLESLNLQYASLIPEAAEHLAEGLRHTPLISSLRVRRVRITLRGVALGEDGAQHLLEGLKHTPSLTLLDLGGGCLCDGGAEALAAGLAHLTRLTDLNVDGSDFSDVGADILFRALTHTPHLTALSVSNLNHGLSPEEHACMGDKGARALAAALHLVPRLTSLGLARCDISIRGARALAKRLPDVPGLANLRLAGNNLGSGLGTLLSAATGLTVLDLRGEEENLSLPALQLGLRRLPSLTTIDLSYFSYGNLGPDLATALGKGLLHAQALSTLCLVDCSIGPDRASDLAHLLRRAPGLCTLELGHNSIGADGAARLAEGLCGATALTHLGLQANRFGDAGVTALAGALGGLPALKVLDLSDNGVCNAGASQLADALRGATALVRLHLEGNHDLSATGEARLCKALGRQPPAPAVEIWSVRVAGSRVRSPHGRAAPRRAPMRAIGRLGVKGQFSYDRPLLLAGE